MDITTSVIHIKDFPLFIGRPAQYEKVFLHAKC